jgi:hypothetical protein
MQKMMVDLRRAGLPDDLPEWMSARDAADLLNLTPRHVRRLAKSILPGMGYRAIAGSAMIHRDLVRQIAEAPPCANHAPTARVKQAKPRPHVRTSCRLQNPRTSAIPSGNHRLASDLLQTTPSANYPGHDGADSGGSANYPAPAPEADPKR